MGESVFAGVAQTSPTKKHNQRRRPSPPLPVAALEPTVQLLELAHFQRAERVASNVGGRKDNGGFCGPPNNCMASSFPQVLTTHILGGGGNSTAFWEFSPPPQISASGKERYEEAQRPLVLGTGSFFQRGTMQDVCAAS